MPDWSELVEQQSLPDLNRWTLMYSGQTKTYVLTEQWLVNNIWTPRTRSSWKTMPEVLAYIAQTNEKRVHGD